MIWILSLDIAVVVVRGAAATAPVHAAAGDP